MNFANEEDYKKELPIIKNIVRQVNKIDASEWNEDIQVQKMSEEQDGDGSLSILNLLFKFTQGQDLEITLKKAQKFEEFHRRLIWLLLKINIEGIKAYEEKYIDQPIENDPIEFWHNEAINYNVTFKQFKDQQMQRVEDEQANVIPRYRDKPRNMTEVGIQTYFSINTDQMFNFEQFGDKFVRKFRVTKDEETMTEAQLVQELGKLPKFDKANVENIGRPYLRQTNIHYNSSEDTSHYFTFQKYVPNPQ